MRSDPVNALLMPLSSDQPWSRDTAAEHADKSDSAQAQFILNRLLKDYPAAFAVRLWNGRMLKIGEGVPAFTFCLKQASVLRELVWFSNPQRLAEAYCAGELQIHGDFHAAMQLREHFESLSLPLHEKLGLLFRALTLADDQHAPSEPLTFTKGHTSTRASTPSIALNYDAPDDFYQCWLDAQMLHSCAYFTGNSADLTQAQQKQLDLICLKLHLQHGDMLIDIACGWGGLACWAAKHYGVFVQGITQNPAQYAYAVKQVKKQGLDHLVTIQLCDYRDLPALGQYDKAVCIGIAEHAGAQQLPHDLKKVHSLLKAGGLFLSHGITTEHPAWQPHASHLAINRQLYPQGALTTLPDLLQHMDTAKFDVFNVEGLRRHYVKTLHCWLSRLEAQHAAVAAHVGERTYRLWRLYMTASAIQFEQGVTGMHQILATRR